MLVGREVVSVLLLRRPKAIIRILLSTAFRTITHLLNDSKQTSLPFSLYDQKSTLGLIKSVEFLFAFNGLNDFTFCRWASAGHPAQRPSVASLMGFYSIVNVFAAEWGAWYLTSKYYLRFPEPLMIVTLFPFPNPLHFSHVFLAVNCGRHSTPLPFS